MNIDQKNKIIIISSPSGAGKTTLCKLLIKKLKNTSLSISYTSRNQRLNEVNGKDYYFVSKKEFENLKNKENFFEYANIFDNYYGTLKSPVLKLLEEGKDVLFDIDWQGTKQLKKIKELSLVTFFILPPNLKILKERLINRHEGQEKLIEKRMEKFEEEVSHWNEYNYVVVNDDLETCYNKILSVMNLEKEGKNHKQDIKEVKKRIEELIS